MKYKFCNYLLPSFNERNDLILYNTLYKNATIIKNEDLTTFASIRSQIMNNGEYVGPGENITVLLHNNILFRSGFDFLTLINQVRDKTFSNTKSLDLTVLPTEKCNFRCVYCYEDYKNGKMNAEVSERIALLITHILPDYQSLNISWFGGEPLLAIDVIENISLKSMLICKSQKKPFCAQITTNGYLLDVNTVRKLIGWHILTYQVTLDGNEITHNKQRSLFDGSKTYDTILNNLLQIKTRIKTNTIRIIVRINVSEDISASDIKSIYELFADDKRFVINPQRVFSTARYQAPNQKFESYYDKIKSCGITIKNSFSPEDSICYAAKENSLLIRSDGSIGKCTVNFDDSNNYFGNILSIDISQFHLKKLKYCNCQQLEENCLNCPVYPICFGKQCPAREKQACAEIIQKYALLVRSLEGQARILELKQ